MEQNNVPFPLPYSTNALEPILSEKQIILHDHLAQGYRTQFPIIQAGVPDVAAQGGMTLREQLRTLSFQGSGYVLHNIYFANMAPVGQGGSPGPSAMTMISSLFPDISAFQTALLNTANSVEGPGWAVFGWLPATSRPYLLQCEEHNNKTIWGIIPIIALDVWEHAYLLDYGADRAAYTQAWWSLLNWNDVERRVSAAMEGNIPMLG